MVPLLPATTNLQEQLGLLEDLYAQCLMDEMDAKSLYGIWSHIKDLRQQLTFSASPLR